MTGKSLIACAVLLAGTLGILTFMPCAGAQSREEATENFTIGRIKYGGGGDWYTDPTTIPNLLRELRQRLNMRTAVDEVIVDLSNPTSTSVPFLYITGHGNVKFNEAEVERLREILESGGFLFANDNGPAPENSMDASFRREMKRVFPESEFLELPADHPLYHAWYDFPDGVPRIHLHDEEQPPMGYGLFHNGRMVCFYNWNADIGNGLESEGVHPEDSEETREKAMQMAINVVLYALSN